MKKILHFNSNFIEVCSQGFNQSDLLLVVAWRRVGSNDPIQFIDTYMHHQVQSNAVITRSRLSCYYIQHCGDNGRHKIHCQTLDSQKTPHSSAWRASYGVSFVKILKKIDRVITAPHCISVWKVVLPSNKKPMIASYRFNTLRPRQNRRQITDIFKRIFFNEYFLNFK